jgi:2-oxo-4-hydroxy-4-carboxy-5-ureidoimidazoline decarboxylase
VLQLLIPGNSFISKNVPMTLSQLNHLPVAELKAVLFKCCGCTAWVNKMVSVFPVEEMIDLFEDAEEKWYECTVADFKEAFSHHPKIGDASALKEKFAATTEWAGNEQAGVNTASEQVLEALAKGNQEYFEKFGYIFIVCATGKSAGEMLALLQERLPNSPDVEIEIAAEEQAKITQLRLEKLLSE